MRNCCTAEEWNETHRLYRLMRADARPPRSVATPATPEEMRQYHRLWRLAFPRASKRKIATPEIIAARRAKFLKRKREYRKQRRQTNLNFKLADGLRSRLCALIKKKHKRNTTIQLLGCSIDSFKLYLESKFESGMTWENYGRNGWHIDHIMPCAIFDLTKPEHQKRCFHFSNMQPLWAHDNQVKSASVPNLHQFTFL